MTNEEFEKAIQFLLDQQASSAGRIEQIESVVLRLANAAEGRMSDFESKASVLIDAQLKSEEKIAALAEAQVQLTEAQAHTEQRLNALIDIVSQGRNGRS